MKLTLEYAESKSPYFANVVRVCKRFKSYKCFKEEGVTVHSVTFEDREFLCFEAIQKMIWMWRGVSYYIDGKLMTRSRAIEVIGRYFGIESYETYLALDDNAPAYQVMKEFLANFDKQYLSKPKQTGKEIVEELNKKMK